MHETGSTDNLLDDQSRRWSRGERVRVEDYLREFPALQADSEQLLDLVWGRDTFVEPRTIDVHVRRLRQQIERDDANPELILTVRSVGYRFNPDALG